MLLYFPNLSLPAFFYFKFHPILFIDLYSFEFKCLCLDFYQDLISGFNLYFSNYLFLLLKIYSFLSVYLLPPSRFLLLDYQLVIPLPFIILNFLIQYLLDQSLHFSLFLLFFLKVLHYQNYFSPIIYSLFLILPLLYLFHLFIIITPVFRVN